MTHRFAVLFTGLALAASSLAAGPAQAGPPSSAALLTAPQPASQSVVKLAKQRLSWSWINDSTEDSRTFREDEYTGREGEIALVLWAAPEYPQRKVRLEVRSKGKWRLLSKGVTDTTAGEGRAVLYINPICTSGLWCNGTYKLRLKVVKRKGYRGATKTVKVTFVRATTTPPTTPPVTPVPTPAPTAPVDCSMYPEGSMEWTLCMHDPRT